MKEKEGYLLGKCSGMKPEGHEEIDKILKNAVRKYMARERKDMGEKRRANHVQKNSSRTDPG